MKFVMQCFAVFALLAVGQASAVKSAGTPIGKVVEMLQGMLVKGKAAKTAEKAEFAKFSVYCSTTRSQTTASISTGADNIVQQKADIGKALSDAEVLAEEIKEAQADVEKMEKELSDATKMRKKERDDYTATHKDFSESIVAIGKATKVIQAKNKDVPQSLLQVQQSRFIPAETKAAITSFIALGDSSETEGPPKANAYEGQTSGIVGILEKLKLKFEDQKTTLEKEEASTKAAFELLNQKLTDSIRDGKATVTDKTAAKAKRLSAAADSKGDLDVTTKGKAGDEKALSDLNTECDAKSREYDKNQVTRADEIKAMETCIGILTSDTVKGAADKHKVLAQLDDAASFAQLRSASENMDKRRTLVQFLQGRAQKLGSKYLSLVASRALTDPFAKVKQMIKDLIVKLLEEANAEADQKGYCDSELGTNKQTRDAKSSEVDELTANIEKLTSDQATMKQDIGTLSEQIGDLRKAMSTQTELRNEEKSENTQTINEAKAAQVAVERATQVMKEFYAQAKDSASLLQTDNSENDSIGDDMAQLNAAPYQGMQGSSGGIIGMLETILSDFAKLEATTSSAEDTATTTYDKFMQDSTEDAEVKGVEMNHLEKKAQTTEETIRSQKKELKATQDELDAALDYYEKLRPDCVDTGVSYQDRVEMRQAEIQSLQEAMKTLSEQ